MQFSFQGEFSVRWHFASTQLKCSDQKLTEGMAERRETESPPDEKSWGAGQRFESRADPKSPGLEPG